MLPEVVVSTATGSQAVDLPQGSSTNIQEGRSVATGAPNEQVQSTESSGQVDDAIFGQGAVANVNNANVTLEQGVSAAVVGNQNFVADSGNNGPVLEGRSVALTGNNNTDQGGAGDFITIAGTGDTATNVTAGNIMLGDGTTNAVLINDSSDTISFGADATGSLNGTADTINLTANSGDILAVYGTNQIVTGDSGSNDIDIGGDGSSIGVFGGGSVDMLGNNQSLNLDTAGSTVDTGSGLSGLSVTGTDYALNVGGDVSGSFSGTGDTINLTANSGDIVALYGPNGIVTGDSGSNDIDIGGDGSSVGVFGGGSVDMLGNNQSLNLDTAGSTVDTGSGLSGLSVTGTDYALNVGGDVSGSFSGTGDTINAGSGLSAFLYGGSDTLNYSGTGNHVLLFGNGNADVVNNSGAGDYTDLRDATTATVNGSGGGIGIDGNNDALTASNQSIATMANATGETFTGSGDTINAGNGLSAFLYGGSDTLNYSGTGNHVLLFGNGNADVVNNSGAGDYTDLRDATTATVNGSGGGIGIDGNNDALTASNQSIATMANATGESFTGSGDTINAGNGLSANLTGNNDNVSVQSGSYIGLIGGGQNDTVTVNGNGDSVVLTGSNDTLHFTPNADNYADVSGTGQTVTGDVGNSDIDISGVGSSVTVYGGGYVGMVGNGQSLTLGTAGSTVGTASNVTGETVNGTNDTVLLATGASATINGVNIVDLAGSQSEVTLESSGDTVDEVAGVTGSVINVTSNNDYINVSDATINVGAGEAVFITGSDNKITMADNSDSYVSVDGLYNTVDSTGNMVSISGDNSEATVIGADTIYMNNNNESLNGNGAHDLIDVGNGIVADIHDDSSTIHEGSSDRVNLNGANDYVETTTGSMVYGYGDLIGDYFTGSTSNYEPEQPASGSYPGNEASSYNNDSSSPSYVTYDTSLNSSDQNNGGDPGDTGYVDTGGYDYTGSNDPDYTGDGDDNVYVEIDEDFGDFVSGSPLLSAPTTTNWALIEDYDLVTSNDPASEKAANAALSQATAVTQEASTSGPNLTPQFEGLSWQGVTPGSGTQTSSNATTITWSFATNAGTAADPFSGYLDAQYKATVEQAIQAWSAVSGLTFEEVPDSASTDIRLGWGDLDTQTVGLLGYTSLQQTDGAIQPGVIIRLEDPSQTALTSGAGGLATYAGTGATLYQVVLHEIGHALGLADDADPNSVMFASSSSSNQTLDQTDIAGIQALYGASAAQAATSSSTQTNMAAATPALAASSSGDTTTTGLNQMIQAMASTMPQASSASAPLVSQPTTQNQQLAVAH